ncbi:penicillin-binding protein 2 [Pannus brasiliensis CCIBt3594]|uniref:Penicillin-binding protein 2 n=1 Tax=Pannus brasiliensis CCIBt3594 TaxID=1427578 RepID=A0AAW9QGR4_9CHRO
MTVVKRPRPSRSNPKKPRTVATARVRPKKRAKVPRVGAGRPIAVWFVLVLGMLGLGWRLYHLQIARGQELQKRARQQQTTSIRPYIPRRAIVDSKGNVLATDRLIYTLYVHPKLFSLPPEEVAEKLAGALDRPKESLLQQFKQKETGVRLADGLTESVARAVKQLSLDGLELEERYARYYPQDEVAADAIGYVDKEHRGQAGLERGSSKLLERDPFSVTARRMGDGRILPAFVPDGIFQFDELQVEVTLDLQLQRAARSALREQLKKFNAKRGAVLVMDSRDGSLLTMVCEPTFNPNEYYKSNVSLFKNWAIADLYEPGSTFKPLVIALALEAGVINPNTIIYDSGAINVGPWTIKNASKQGNGPLDMARVLQTSSNVAMVQIGARMNRKDYYHRLLGLKINEKSGVDLPGEAVGHLKSEEEFEKNPIESATTSFGQGFSLTPLKLVQLHGALANGGTLVTPHIIKGLVDDRGRSHWEPDYPKSKVFSPTVTRQVVEMMETVVSKGTGTAAKIPGYRIGGKTGTAQKASPTGGYLPNAKITSFVSIFPIESPRYVVLVVVDEPKGANTFGSTVAAPVAKTVIDTLISLKGIPPSSKVSPEEAEKESAPRHD